MRTAATLLTALLITAPAPMAMAASDASPRLAAGAQAAPRLKRLDSNGDKRISAAEWAARQGRPRPQAFTRLDANRDGYVDASELQARVQAARRAAPVRAERAQRRAERLEKRAGRG